MTKILIVSDNLDLVSFMQDLTKAQTQYHIDFSYSEINKYPEKFIRLGMSPINFKDPYLVKETIKNYN